MLSSGCRGFCPLLPVPLSPLHVLLSAWDICHSLCQHRNQIDTTTQHKGIKVTSQQPTFHSTEESMFGGRECCVEKSMIIIRKPGCWMVDTEVKIERLLGQQFHGVGYRYVHTYMHTTTDLPTNREKYVQIQPTPRESPRQSVINTPDCL
jgi:hypothetical protein